MKIWIEKYIPVMTKVMALAALAAVVAISAQTFMM